MFREVDDLSPAERQHFFDQHRVPAELRAEVESLLAFDSPDAALGDLIAGEADAFLKSRESPTEGLRCGPYRLSRLLGRGGVGEVYLAERDDGQFVQRVAIKFLRQSAPRPSFRIRFTQERQILAGLQHPGIARLLDAGETGEGQPYLVLDYIDGAPMDVYCRTLDLGGKLRLFLRVCDAVAYAHRNLIIHRDIKPSNILVNAAGEPKLLDFGLAKILDAVTDQTRTLERLLTPDFASPEQVRGTAQTTATDVYSLGAVLYHLLTGRSPHDFRGTTPQAIDAAICFTEPPPARRLNPELPQDVDLILRKALRKEPEDRYSSVDALAHDIRAFLEWRPIQARSGNTWYRVRRFVRRYWMPVSAAVAVIVSLATGLYIADHQRAVAEAHVIQLRRLARQLLDFEGQLTRQDAGSDLNLHREIIATSIQYLEGLGPEALRDQQLALEIADAYLQIARIQGVPEWNQQGQYAAAEKSLIKVTEIAHTVLLADPANRKALWQTANAAHDHAVIAYAEHRPGEVAAWSPQAVEGFDRLSRLGNLTRHEVNGGTYIYGDLAEVHMGLHRFQDAVRYARLGIDYSRNTSTVPGPRAQAFNMLTGALQYLGDFQGSQVAMSEARKAWEQLLHDEGDKYYTRVILYQTRCREGLLLGEDGSVNLNRPREAAIRLQEAFEALEPFALADRNNHECRTIIAVSGHFLGDLLRHSDPQRALGIYDHSLLRIREIPDDVAARRTEAILLAGSSYAARRMRHENDAAARIDTAFHLLRETGDYPAAAIQAGSEADIAVRALAAHYAETGRPNQAIRSYQELRRAIMASNPDTRNDLLNAVSLTELDACSAALLRRAGAADQAAALEAGSRELWRHWDRQLPNNPFVLRQIAALVAPSPAIH